MTLDPDLHIYFFSLMHRMIDLHGESDGDLQGESDDDARGSLPPPLIELQSDDEDDSKQDQEVRIIDKTHLISSTLDTLLSSFIDCSLKRRRRELELLMRVIMACKCLDLKISLPAIP